MTEGSRQGWASAVDQLLDGDPVVAKLASTWPWGLVACQRALAEARDDLEVFVTGKTVIDALVTAIRRELGAAPA